MLLNSRSIAISSSGQTRADACGEASMAGLRESRSMLFQRIAGGGWRSPCARWMHGWMVLPIAKSQKSCSPPNAFPSGIGNARSAQSDHSPGSDRFRFDARWLSRLAATALAEKIVSRLGGIENGSPYFRHPPSRPFSVIVAVNAPPTSLALHAASELFRCPILASPYRHDTCGPLKLPDS